MSNITLSLPKQRHPIVLHHMIDPQPCKSDIPNTHGLNEVPATSSVFWKPLDRMIQDGAPIDPVTILWYDLGDRKLPFAAIAKTRGQRLVLWPPSDSNESGEFMDDHRFPIHHVTLELLNSKTHFTQYDKEGNRVHDNRNWKLRSISDGLRLWLVMAYHIPYLERQIGVVEQKIKMPRNDSKRRTEEYRRYASTLKHVGVRIPPIQGDTLISLLYLQTSGLGCDEPVEHKHFPMGSFWNDWIRDWPDGNNFLIARTAIEFDGVKLLLLSASPPGKCNGNWFLGAASG